MSPISARFAPGHEVHSADTLATQRTHPGCAGVPKSAGRFSLTRLLRVRCSQKT